eukprot:Gregarina_sp_Poly_1__6011@NODE_3167_length_1313_cov_818_174157_g2013_i0_p1_GENE_NODE_3167_length_1313_cov_818_174157_g2013_i0NODE_3167_length_1313_cov_818_174157_g2013_i0_p1_ORF_typecomplete_len311_score41_66_NODE_3167_length_1313_cov_818_174157_g2013_i03041236
MKAIALCVSFMSIECLSQPADRFDSLIDRLLMPNVFDTLFQRTLDDRDQAKTDAGGATMMSDVLQNDRGINGLRFPFMLPFSDLMGLSFPSLFDASGFLADLFGNMRNFEVPNVTLSDAECLITVDLKDLDVNNTSFKVYGSATSGISVEISTTKQFEATEDEDDAHATNSDLVSFPIHLRGASSFSSFTTVRSFPTPRGCDITSENSKATINEKTNQLLIKLPKLPVSDEVYSELAAPEEAKLMHASQQLSEVPKDEAIVRSALSVDEPRSSGGSSWLSRLFGMSDHIAEEVKSRSAKVQVPLVKYDEF